MSDNEDDYPPPPPPPIPPTQVAATPTPSTVAPVLAAPMQPNERAQIESDEGELQKMLQQTSIAHIPTVHPQPLKPPPPLVTMTHQEQTKHDALNPPPSYEEKHGLPPPRRLLIEGQLQKKSPNALFSVYQERYFVLYSDKLEYYKARDDFKTGKQPQGIIPLFSIKCVLNLGPSKGKPLKFDVVIGEGSSSRTFELQALTPYECEQWCEGIRRAMKELEKSGTPTPSSTTGAVDGKFWKNTQVVEQTLTSPTSSSSTTSIQSPTATVTSPKPSATTVQPTPAPSVATVKSPTAAVSASTPSVSSPPKAATELRELPLQLQLVKPMSKGGVISGSFIYLAKDRSSDAFYLVHTIRKSGNADEVAAKSLFSSMSKLSHPYAAQQLYSGSTSDAFWSIYVPAFRVQDSLLHYLTLYRRIPEEVVKHIGSQLVCLLGYLHKQNAIARNLSSENLYFTGDGSVTFLDFFLTSPLKHGAAAVAEETLIPEFMTPELIKGLTETRTSDWWRFGVLLYELAVGIPPFRATAAALTRNDRQEQIAQKLVNHSSPTSTELKFPPFVSAGFQSLVRDLLTTDMTKRLGSGPNDASDVKQHGYWRDWDWTPIELGELQTVPSWVKEKVLNVVHDPQATQHANPSASPDQLKHLLQPVPKNSRRQPPTHHHALHVHILAARGFEADSGTHGLSVELGATATGETRAVKVTPPASVGANPTINNSWTLDFSATGYTHQSAGDVTIEIKNLPAAGAKSQPTKAGTITVPIQAISSFSHILPQDLPEAQLDKALVELLASNTVFNPPTPQWYSMLNDHALTVGELQVLFAWVEIRIPVAQPEPTVVTLSNTFNSYFGSCEGGEDYAAVTNAALEVPTDVTQKFHTPGTRGRNSVFGSLLPPGVVGPSGARVAPATGSDSSVLRPVDLGRSTPPPPPPKDDDDDDDDDEDDEDEGEAEKKSASSKQGGASNMIRGLVSKKKLRYQEDGFDLDLSYITPRIIAMGFPSVGTEAMYRNPMVEVQRFFSLKHPGHFRVYNLCSERKYDHKSFDGSVCDIPFNDHNAPEFGLLMMFCRDAHKFLEQDPENVIAVHCKAGKGRTGTMIAAYLLYEQHSASADDALTFFGLKRTKNGKGVTIPSQRRYVAYFAEFLQRFRIGNSLSATIPSIPSPVALRLKHIRLTTVPNFDIGGGCDPYFLVRGPPPECQHLYDYRQALKKHGLKIQSCHEKGREHIEMALPGNMSNNKYNGPLCDVQQGCILVGDFKVCFFDEDTLSGDDAMFHIWLNTAFIPPSNHLTLTKVECDKAVKDTKCAKFDANFKIELWFDPAEL